VVVYVRGPIAGHLLFNNRISEPDTLDALSGSFILGILSGGLIMFRQLEMFRARQSHCRECGRLFLELSPDLFAQRSREFDRGLGWAQDMGFCSVTCIKTRDRREHDLFAPGWEKGDR